MTARERYRKACEDLGAAGERQEQAAEELCHQLDIEQSRRDYAEAMAQWRAREVTRPGPHRLPKSD